MEQFLGIVSWMLLILGSMFVFIGGLGALRMPDLYTRMHAAGITDSIAPILIIPGIILQAGLSFASLKLLAILFLLFLTGPTASNTLASAALLTGNGSEGKRIAVPESKE